MEALFKKADRCTLRIFNAAFKKKKQVKREDFYRLKTTVSLFVKFNRFYQSLHLLHLQPFFSSRRVGK